MSGANDPNHWQLAPQRLRREKEPLSAPPKCCNCRAEGEAHQRGVKSDYISAECRLPNLELHFKASYNCDEITAKQRSVEEKFITHLGTHASINAKIFKRATVEGPNKRGII